MKFRMFADSVHGKKYFDRGLPCQDFSDTTEFDGVQAIAVADGHGGKDYFRSDTGAKLAVEVAFAQVKKFCKDVSDDEIFSVNGIKNFEHAVWNAWREAVMNHWRENPVTEDEFRWQTVSDKYKARFTSTDEKILAKYIPVAYGTTLICAVSIGSQVLITQIGDGTCVVLQRDGEFTVAVPPDSENFANVTTSLCDENAFGKFRDKILACDENLPSSPVAIFLSTDGLDDCYLIFENEKYLYKLYSETVIGSLITNGFELTNKALHEELLPYMTERGSNDDISLAYLVTEDLNLLKAAVEKFSTTPAEKSDTEKISTPTVNNVTEKVSTSTVVVDNTEKISTTSAEKFVAEKMTPTPIVNIEPTNFPPQSFSPSPILKAWNLTFSTTPVIIESKSQSERSDKHEQP